MIKHYGRKPLIVTAVQWDGSNIQEILSFTDNKAVIRKKVI